MEVMNVINEGRDNTLVRHDTEPNSAVLYVHLFPVAMNATQGRIWPAKSLDKNNG